MQFTTLHVMGRNDATQPWTGRGETKATPDTLTRVTVDGSENNTNWLRVTVNEGRTDVLSGKQMPFSG